MLELEVFLKEFGKTLKNARKQMGLSQVTAAHNMKIDYRHYQNIEGGKINLRLDTFMKLVKFYNLNNGGDLTIKSAVNLMSEQAHTPPPKSSEGSWPALKSGFVDSEQAGFFTLNADHEFEHVNEKLIKTLGYRSSQELVGRSLPFLMLTDNFINMIDRVRQSGQQISPPFTVTLRTQPPAFPIPMMAIVRVVDQSVECILLDRKTLEAEESRLSELLGGYQQFKEIYPQLRAV